MAVAKADVCGGPLSRVELVFDGNSTSVASPTFNPPSRRVSYAHALVHAAPPGAAEVGLLGGQALVDAVGLALDSNIKGRKLCRGEAKGGRDA